MLGRDVLRLGGQFSWEAPCRLCPIREQGAAFPISRLKLLTLSPSLAFGEEGCDLVTRDLRHYLTNLAAQEDRGKNARAPLRELSAQSAGRLGKKTWTRNDLYDR